VRNCHAEESVERKFELWTGRFTEESHSAQNAPILDDRLHDCAELRFVVDCEIDRKKRDALQCDAVLPFLAHLGEDRPGDGCLFAEGIQVGADCPAAMSKRATQREIHPGVYVVPIPARLTVGRNRCAGAGMRAIRIATTWPYVPFVEMRVHVDETR
jgi:hypothetical protein